MALPGLSQSPARKRRHTPETMQFITTAQEDLGREECPGYQEGTSPAAVPGEVSDGLKEELGL